MLLSFVVHAARGSDFHVIAGTNRDYHNNAPAIVVLKKGEAGVVSYEFCWFATNMNAMNNPMVGPQFFLRLHNTGTKWIRMDEVSKEDFSLLDAHGKSIKLSLTQPPEGMAYGKETMIGVTAERALDTRRSWTFRFKTKPGAHVPVDLLIKSSDPAKPSQPSHD